MSKKSEIDLDFLDEYIKLFSLSDDITKATEADKNHISKAIHIKLSYDTINCIDDCIEDFEKEIKNYPHVLAKKYGIEPKSKERMLEFLQQKPWLLSNITRASETLSDINEFKDEHNGHYSFLTPDETCEKILSWVTTINRLRASYDIVPLVTRAIYADKVRAAIDVWHNNKNSPNANKEDFWQIELKIT